jgi:hypothetical protein
MDWADIVVWFFLILVLVVYILRPTFLGQVIYQLYNNTPSNTIVNAAYSVSYNSLLEADATCRCYTPILQTAVLITSFIVILPMFVTRLLCLA